MKRGDIVGKRHFTDFKGIIIDLVERLTDDFGEYEIIMWKVLWFKHPYAKNHSEMTETLTEKELQVYA